MAEGGTQRGMNRNGYTFGEHTKPSNFRNEGLCQIWRKSVSSWDLGRGDSCVEVIICSIYKSKQNIAQLWEVLNNEINKGRCSFHYSGSNQKAHFSYGMRVKWMTLIKCNTKLQQILCGFHNNFSVELYDDESARNIILGVLCRVNAAGGVGGGGCVSSSGLRGSSETVWGQCRDGC